MEDDGESEAGSQEVLEKESGLVGGSLRSLLRIVTARLKLAPVKVRVRPRQIAKSANHASTVFDIYNYYKSGHSDNLHYSVHTRKQLVHAKAFFFAAPMYLRSVVFDTALFFLYEQSIDKAAASMHYIIPYVADKDTEGGRRAAVPWVAFGAGLLGGFMHGYLTTFWDHKYYSTLDFFKHHNRVKLNRIGAAVSGSLCYASLFGGYEASKYALLYALSLKENREDMSRVEGFVCICISGLFSGFLNESLSYYTSSFETLGVKSGMNSIKSLPRGSLRVYLPGMASSAIGFIAYEYTKDHFEIN